MAFVAIAVQVDMVAWADMAVHVSLTHYVHNQPCPPKLSCQLTLENVHNMYLCFLRLTIGEMNEVNHRCNKESDQFIYSTLRLLKLVCPYVRTFLTEETED